MKWVQHYRFMHDAFRRIVCDYYRAHGRHDLPWRLPGRDGSFDPYKILVSEIMLQQTQVPRVVPKYAAFLERFPDIQTLAAAPLGEVLIAWQGLGYNRRAKFLWQAAQMMEGTMGGVFPHSRAELERLPGVGANTAGAVLAYAFNEPVVFIETNIRTVFIHHFFPDGTSAGVSDKAIAEYIEKTLDADNPRVWYWALMDYGAHLKQTVGNLSRASRTYARQSRFVGSSRQLRGRVLRRLAQGPADRRHLLAELGDPRTDAVLRQLEAEGLLRRQNGTYALP